MSFFSLSFHTYQILRCGLFQVFRNLWSFKMGIPEIYPSFKKFCLSINDQRKKLVRQEFYHSQDLVKLRLTD